jgi:hypothetical protein
VCVCVCVCVFFFQISFRAKKFNPFMSACYEVTLSVLQTCRKKELVSCLQFCYCHPQSKLVVVVGHSFIHSFVYGLDEEHETLLLTHLRKIT